MTSLTNARKAAADVVEMLAPGCKILLLAGSIRRERPDVRDIEICCVPLKGGKPVWGEPATAAGPLEATVARLIQSRQLRFDADLKRNGPRYKRFVYERGAIRLPVDLFIADASGDNWGNLLAIRTGDADFSRHLVLKQSAGGLMPKGYFHHEGWLKHLERGVVPVKTEEAYFDELGIPFVPPAERDLGAVQRLLRERVLA